VLYKPVDSTIYVGSLRIETEALFEGRKAAAKEAAKPKL